ncbi:alpha-glucuronidase family glycosyl hydrolase [Chitinophaga sancti]|uniref:alpha-glucuronidase family glycosyl hydrolase n=1 Tax=Chitinophaga sancti TaxID=1004 RepID=UPI002A76272E|nr:alpha-glucuronidase family glycosyl hydrolase [Chitinophaga sancti]WPQ63286.1 alpha-glucuronidase family glycosyl hydrolase [Chitinophaga sancti]
MRYIVLIVLLLQLYPCFSKVPVIVHSKQASGATLLAIKELQRYIYVRTGELPRVSNTDADNSIWVGTIDAVTIKDQRINQQLKGDAYQLLSVSDRKLIIVGGSEIATLYGAYKFLESTGIGFALDDDIIPDTRINQIQLSGFNKTYAPAFALRGIQPFHDFPEGPDWWNEDDYKAIIGQLPKMGMNFIGFHTYPSVGVFRGWYKPEPVVWIGTKEQFDPATGHVNNAYPVLHANTNDSTWDYYPKKTSAFNFGAAQLFETDNYGADYMKGVSNWPHTPEENIHIFNKVGSVLNGAFSLAKELGVKTCVGTETALTIPNEVKRTLPKASQDSIRQALYEGMFSRIKATYPLDYYWFWTPEDWTWSGERPGETDFVKKDLLSAVAAAKAVKAPFTLATCGWVLGPSRNRAEFDQLLPKEMPFSVINRQQGYTPVEPAFATVTERPKWEITWMEDDPALICPQFWAGRTRKDAQDAFKYGCTGLMGIHWRTRNISPNFMALAKAGWEANTYDKEVPADKRDYPVGDLYDEWATLQFGKDAAKMASTIFQRFDGAAPVSPEVTDYTANFPRATIWGIKGPGLIIANKVPWDSVVKGYDFISEFEKCGKLVHTPSQVANYQYWLHTFYYARAISKVGCLLGEMDTIAKLLPGKKELGDSLLVLRDSTAGVWEEMMTALLQTVSTTGEMGMIANIEQHNMQRMQYLTRYDSLIAAARGGVPPLVLSKEYKGPARVVVTTKRTMLNAGESLDFRVRVLSGKAVKGVKLYWKELGGKAFSSEAVEREGANVYKVHVGEKKTDFEYYIKVEIAGGESLRYPEAGNRTVVVW